jgi:predicted Holliday junction resolvase-like endonuclease
MEGWQIALVVLIAVLVGALIPLLVQLYGAIHAVRTVAEKSARDIEAALHGIHRTADRLDRLGADLEKDGKLAEIVEGAASAAQMVNQLRSTMQVAGPVAAAVVPAVAAAVRAWKASMDSDPPPDAAEDRRAHEGSPRERKEAAG